MKKSEQLRIIHNLVDIIAGFNATHKIVKAQLQYGGINLPMVSIFRIGNDGDLSELECIENISVYFGWDDFAELYAKLIEKLVNYEDR